MGGNQSTKEIIYNVPVGDKPSNSTPTYRCKGYENELICMPEGINNMQDLFIKSCEKFPNNQLLGTKKDGKYEFITYQEVFAIAKALGTGLQTKNLYTTVSHQPQDMNLVGIFSKNRNEWLLTEYANFLYNGTLVPLYDTLGPDSIDFVLNQTGMETIVASQEGVTALLKCKNPGNLKNIVAMDELTNEEQQQISEKGWNLVSFWGIIEEFKQKEANPFVKIESESIFTFSYTSGTTGDPKGALVSHKNMTSICYLSNFIEYKYSDKDVYLSYLPLPHIFERLMVCIQLYQGGVIGFYNGNVLKLKEDLESLKPTVFASVPRLYNKFYDKIKNGIESAKGVKGFLAQKGLKTKMDDNMKDNSCDNAFWDKLVFNKVKMALGGNVKLCCTGGAPISPEVQHLLRCALCVPLQQGYGSTETTGATFNTSRFDPQTGHVGGVQPNSEFKLEDIPDMNYLSTDKDENGKPAPRGEICIRGHSIFKGYYKNQEKTDEAIDKDGWLHTGDVGLILPNGALKIIDRKKNLFKLAQGEYIAPEKIENTYLTNKWADEVWIYGDTLQSTLVTFVVPNKERVDEWAKNNNVSGDYASILENKDLRKLILKELNQTGKESKLFGFEQARNIKLIEKSFNDLGVTTTTFKIKRKDARDLFEKDIEDLYANAL